MAADKAGRAGPRRAVTLRDVALAAGVHPSTVSRSLDPGQSARVNEATRERVLEVARALEYEPDLVAKSLRNQRTNTVGVVVPDFGNPLYAGMIRGLNRALERQGYASVMSETTDDSGRLEHTLNLFTRRRVDAVVVASAREHDRPVLRQFARQGVPLVMAIRWIKGVNVPIVANDDRYGGALAAAHLIELGHRRLAQLHGPADIETFVERGTGFSDTVARAGLDEPMRPASATGPTVAEGRRLMALLLRSAKEPPTAVFAHNDLMAIGAFEALQEAGLSCPGDVSVIGYNDIPLVEHLDPPLSTISMPVTEVGRVAAETALTLVDGGPTTRLDAAVSINLRPTLVPRRSTAARRDLPAERGDGAGQAERRPRRAR
jgi:LacI family transcriptional regulator